MMCNVTRLLQVFVIALASYVLLPVFDRGAHAADDNLSLKQIETLESRLVRDIIENGVGNRLVVPGIATQVGASARLSISDSGGSGFWSLQMEFPSDRIPQTGLSSAIFGHKSIHRFIGTVRYDNAKLPVFKGDGNIKYRLTFVLLRGVGYVYLRGKGSVTYPDGRVVTLNNKKFKVAKNKPARRQSSKKRRVENRESRGEKPRSPTFADTLDDLFFESSFEKLTALFGQPIKQSNYKSGFTGITYKQGSAMVRNGVIMSLSCSSMLCETNKGIRVGDDKSKIIKKYGEGKTSKSGQALQYRIKYPDAHIKSKLTFKFKQDKVSLIYFWRSLR